MSLTLRILLNRLFRAWRLWNDYCGVRDSAYPRVPHFIYEGIMDYLTCDAEKVPIWGLTPVYDSLLAELGRPSFGRTDWDFMVNLAKMAV